MESINLQEELREIYAKKQLEIEAAYAKGQMQNQIRLELDNQKALAQEYRREMRKARYSEVMIRENGELEVETKSSIISLPKRKAANFKFLDLFRLISVNGDGPIFVLFIEIGAKEILIYLDGEKVGRGEYLLKKINEVGGKVYIESKKKKAEFLVDFWASAITYEGEELLIPVFPGWISTGRGEYRFVKEEERTWEKIAEKVK